MRNPQQCMHQTFHIAKHDGKIGHLYRMLASGRPDSESPCSFLYRDSQASSPAATYLVSTSTGFIIVNVRVLWT